MTFAVIGVIITVPAIGADKFTLFTHSSLPAMALVGILTVILSPALPLSVS